MCDNVDKLKQLVIAEQIKQDIANAMDAGLHPDMAIPAIRQHAEELSDAFKRAEDKADKASP